MGCMARLSANPFGLNQIHGTLQTPVARDYFPTKRNDNVRPQMFLDLLQKKLIYEWSIYLIIMRYAHLHTTTNFRFFGWRIVSICWHYLPSGSITIVTFKITVQI